jgi:perosamine synthetase
MKDNTETPFAEIVGILGTMLPKGAALHEPVLAGAEWDYVKDCLDTGWVSSVGSYVNRFEDMLRDITGAASVSATVTGTAALHACLMLAGVEVGDEVIVPPLSFAASANAVSHCHAVPHFVDIDTRDLAIDAAKLDVYLTDILETRGDVRVNWLTGRPIRAVVCVHVFGHAADIDALAQVCARHGLVLIEDAAESLGTLYNGRHTGNVGRLAALSFNGNKTVTTGGGGAVMTNDAELGRRAKHVTTTAKLAHPWRYDHDEVGYNYRLPNINAALGCAQLEQLDGFIAAKRALAERYIVAFKNVPGVSIFAEPKWSRSNYWLNTLILDAEFAAGRDELLRLCHDANILARPAWTPLHQLAPYRNCPHMPLDVAEDMAARIVNLPSGAALGRSA